MQSTVSQQVDAIGKAFAVGLVAILHGKLYGAYVYGAAAFPDAVPTGDIDFHVILTEALTEGERRQLLELHDVLAREYPPLGGELDGYYLLLEDARQTSPPQSQMWARATDHSWALHCEHIRAGRHIILHGPDPVEIYPPATWPEIERALRGELRYVQEHLHEYPDYCILNLCRLMYSSETRDVVVSKAQAAAWGYEALPDWRRPIDLARKSYAGEATAQDRDFMLAAVTGLYESAVSRIEWAGQANRGTSMVDESTDER